MSRRRKRGGHVNHDRWLVSYADFITLLFAFFVVLYASSQVDKRKVGRLALAIQVAFQEMGVFEASTTHVPINLAEPMPFSTVQAIENVEHTGSVARIASHPDGTLGGGTENGDLAQLQAELETLLAAEIKRKEIAMRRDPDGLVISLREAGFFDSGAAQMKSTSQATFDQIANMLLRRQCRLRIEGHTDNVPIHNSQFSSNWELSTARATEVVRLLIVRDGFNPARLSAAGFAEFHPIATNANADGRGMNRRVDIVILGHEPATGPDAQDVTRAQNSPATPVPGKTVSDAAAQFKMFKPSPASLATEPPRKR
ncbi:MAG: flagellar motor protein MotB [Terriglobales bacterium]|jgi:chemotaxis protein MotB